MTKNKVYLFSLRSSSFSAMRRKNLCYVFPYAFITIHSAPAEPSALVQLVQRVQVFWIPLCPNIMRWGKHVQKRVVLRS